MKSRKDASLYLEDGELQSFEMVKSLVGESLFVDIVKVIEKDFKAASKEEGIEVKFSGDQAASKRLYYFVRSLKNAIKEDPSLLSTFLQKEEVKTEEGKLSPRKKIDEQWKLIRTSKEFRRNNSSDKEYEEIFSMKEGDWSHSYAPPHGDIHFFQMKGSADVKVSSVEQVKKGKKNLAKGAKRYLMQGILSRLEDSESIKIDPKKVN